MERQSAQQSERRSGQPPVRSSAQRTIGPSDAPAVRPQADPRRAKGQPAAARTAPRRTATVPAPAVPGVPGTRPTRRGGGQPRPPAPPRGPRQPSGRRRKRPPVRWGLRITGALALAVITASGLGHAMVSQVSSTIGRVDVFTGVQGRPATTKGTNFLLVGTDGRDGLDPGEKQRFHLGGAPCHCTDTMMLVHLSADRHRASVVSIPRDTLVQLPGAGPKPQAAAAPASSAVPGAAHRGARSVTALASPAAASTHPGKINQAYALGGPRLTVRMVEQLTGVHIDHYLEIDFTSFMKTVDVLGGVKVCTQRPLRDAYTGLDLPAGTSTLDGGQALQYVRSRHIDGAADLSRMRRQQKFLAQVIHKITGGGLLTDPVELARAAKTVLGSVRADQGLGTSDLIALAQGMKGFSTSSSEFAQVPLSNVNDQVPGVGSTVVWDARRAGQLWAAIRADRPLAAPAPAGTAAPARTAAPAPAGGRAGVDPSTVRVRVTNGTSVNGLAAAAQNALHATGFVTLGLPTTAAHHAPRTVVQYDPRWDRSARTLAAAVPGARLVPSPGQGPVMLLTLGPDFTRVAPPATPPPPASPQSPQSPANPSPTAPSAPAPASGTSSGTVRGDEVACP